MNNNLKEKRDINIPYDGKPNLNGPESVPLRDYITSLPIVVSVYKLGTDVLMRQETVDYGQASHRQWIGKVTAWACLNGCSVETMSKEDFDKEERE